MAGCVGDLMCIRVGLLDRITVGLQGTQPGCIFWNIHRVPAVYPAVGQRTPTCGLEWAMLARGPGALEDAGAAHSQVRCCFCL